MNRLAIRHSEIQVDIPFPTDVWIGWCHLFNWAKNRFLILNFIRSRFFHCLLEVYHIWFFERDSLKRIATATSRLVLNSLSKTLCSSADILGHAAISPRVRWHPRHKPLTASIWQIEMQGDTSFTCVKSSSLLLSSTRKRASLSRFKQLGSHPDLRA